MTARIRRWAALFAVAAFALLVHSGRADDKAPPKGQLVAGEAKIFDLLAKPVDVDPFEGKFDEAVKMLREKYNLPLTMDHGPRLENDEDPDKVIKLPKLANVRLETVLRLVCNQVSGAFLVEPDHIRITGSAIELIESGVWKFDPAYPIDQPSPLPPIDQEKYQPAIKRALVNAAFKDKPAAEILNAIAESTGANVILAPQAAEKAGQALTIRFANTPVEAAVRTLCEMTDLGVIEDTNVLIVTTPERATARNKTDEQKRKARYAEIAATQAPSGQVPSNLTGVPGGAGRVVASPELMAELVKLKEQNEQLKRQLDEIQKQLRR